MTRACDSWIHPAAINPQETIGSRWPVVPAGSNYPFSSARNPGEPDPNEFIIIRLDRPIRFFARTHDR